MGKDIHIHLINKEGQIVSDNLYDGRNSEWFENISNRTITNNSYIYLPRYYHHDHEEVLLETYKQEDGYYGYTYIPTEELAEWFNKYKPFLQAGWVRKYDAWAYINKNIPIDDNYYTELPYDARIEDWEFFEFEDYYEPMINIMNKICNLDPDLTLSLFFCFDW